MDPRLGKPEINSPSEDLPLYAEAAVGWRAWQTNARLKPGQESGVILTSPTKTHFVWRPFKPTLAQCDFELKGKPPHKGCGCGIYAADSLKNLLKLNHPNYNVENGLVTVIGEVYLYGVVEEHTLGYKAEMAYPKKLYVPFECWQLAVPISNTYGVEVGLKNWLKLRANHY